MEQLISRIRKVIYNQRLKIPTVLHRSGMALQMQNNAYQNYDITFDSFEDILETIKERKEDFLCLQYFDDEFYKKQLRT